MTSSVEIAADARRTVASLMPKRAVGAEIGVFRGAFSAMLVRHARPKKLYLVDPWENSDAPEHEKTLYSGSGKSADMNENYRHVATRLKRQIDDGRVEMVRKYSHDFLAELDDGHLDFVYIDGDHNYAAVKKDLTLAFQKVKPGGIIAVDDYLDSNWWGRDVIRATHEALLEHEASLLFMLDNQVVMARP